MMGIMRAMSRDGQGHPWGPYPQRVNCSRSLARGRAPGQRKKGGLSSSDWLAGTPEFLRWTLTDARAASGTSTTRCIH